MNVKTKREAIAIGLKATLDIIWAEAYYNGKGLPFWFKAAAWLEYKWRPRSKAEG